MIRSLGSTLLELMTAIGILATVMVITSQALSSGTDMRDMVAAHADSDDQANRLVQEITQDLRYADINRIYLDTDNSPTWFSSGGTGDFYSFKACTGFNTVSGSVTSMSRLVKYDRGVVLHFAQDPARPTNGILSRTVYQLDASGATIGTIQPETRISDQLAWSFLPAGSSTPRKGFEITQLFDGTTTVVGNRLQVFAAVRPSTDDSQVGSAESPKRTSISTTSSAVFLRSTLFEQFGVLPPVITSSTTAQGNVGTAFRYDLKAANYPTSYAMSIVPTGLTFDFRTGILQGVPALAQTLAITMHAANAAGSDSRVLTLTVGGPIPAITSPSNGNPLRAIPFTYQITASNGPTSYAAAPLPPGLTVNKATGLISGSATTVGTYAVMLSAANANGIGTRGLTLAVTEAQLAKPVITGPAVVTAVIGRSFAVQIQASNFPTVYSCSGLPAGLSLNAATGIISGTSSSGFDGNIPVAASNLAGSGSGAIRLIVQPAVPVVASGSLTGTVGTALTYRIQATESPTSYAAKGLPGWLSGPGTSGILTGIPTAVGHWSIDVSATNGAGTGTGVIDIVIESLPSPSVTSILSASGNVGVAFFYQITASNNPTAYTASGKPSWLQVDARTGILSGSPTATGTFTVAIAASNASGTGSADLTISVGARPQAPNISMGVNQANGNKFYMIGSISPATGRTVNYSTFSCTANQSGYTLKRGWVPSEMGSGAHALAANEFSLSGDKPSGLLAVTAGVSDDLGTPATAVQNY